MNDKCLVVVEERDTSKSTSGYFNFVGEFMKEFNMTNIEDRLVYSHCTQPLKLDKKSLSYFRKILNKRNTVCHHPFLCELNKDCKGKVLLSHCCIRPSHLVNLNKHFNDYCTLLQNIYKNGQSSITARWVRNDDVVDSEQDDENSEGSVVNTSLKSNVAYKKTGTERLLVQVDYLSIFSKLGRVIYNIYIYRMMRRIRMRIPTRKIKEIMQSRMMRMSMRFPTRKLKKRMQSRMMMMIRMRIPIRKLKKKMQSRMMRMKVPRGPRRILGKDRKTIGSGRFSKLGYI